MKKSIRQVQYYLIALLLIIIGSSCKKQEKQTRTTKVVQATKPADKKQGKKKNLLRFYEKAVLLRLYRRRIRWNHGNATCQAREIC